MQKLILSLGILLNLSCTGSQKYRIDQTKIKEDLNEIITDLSQNYVYLKDKNVDLDCIRSYYEKQIKHLKTEEETVLFFEYLLDEFYDSHLILNTNRNSSFRLYSPIYVTIENETPVISNVWQTQIADLNQAIIGAEIEKINGIDFRKVIDEFPTYCNDKNSQEVREWIANKILAGRYNEKRMLTLKLIDHSVIEIDLDKINFRSNDGLLMSWEENGIGIIRINNSLGNNKLIQEFDNSLNELMNTKGLIVDLRNTVDGGNSYVARGLMGRFIDEKKPYQVHLRTEQYNQYPKIERSWIEYVSPRERCYQKPLVVLVGRWTGSMGEGLAIGFEGMGRAEVVGSEMERLAGEMSGFSFKNQDYGYRLSTAKLFHVNGTAREKYIPKNYVRQTTVNKDETLEKGIALINKMAE